MLVVKGAQVIDILRDTVEECTWVVDDQGYFEQHGRDSSANAATSVNADGLYMVPGLIDAHVHLGLPRSGPASTRDDPMMMRNRLAQLALRTLAGGVTLLRDQGDRPPRGMVLAELANELGSPRVFSALSGLTVKKGYATFLADTVRDDEELLAAVRKRAECGAKVIKLFLTGGVDFETGVVSARQFDQRSVALAASAAHQHGLPLAVHANGTEAVMIAVTAGADTIEHGILLDEVCMKALTERGVFWVPTLTPLWRALQAAERERAKTGIERFLALPGLFRRHQQAVAQAVAMGVKVVAGTDAGAPGVSHGSLAVEIEQLIAAGMTPSSALRAGTLVAAEALGVGDRAGAIEAGRWGDFLLLRGNPSVDVTAFKDIVATYVGGKLVTGQGSPS